MTATAVSLAIEGGPKVREMSWPQWPVWGAEEERLLLEVLHSGRWWSMGGSKVRDFEAAFSGFHDARHAIAVTNGTAALEVTLRSLGIGPGDEVIVPPYTFIATATAVLAVGAVPIFADIEEQSLNLDAARVESAITPRTKAVIPVHISGGPANLDPVLAVARRHNLFVIEDASQAHGAEYRGRKVGAIGDFGTFSFQASKNLNAGEGGIILTNDDGFADAAWSVHNVGRARDGGWYEHHVLGGNFRMTEWQGAVLLAQLARLPEQAVRRTENAAYLTRLLGTIPGIVALPAAPWVTRHAYHLYIFRYDHTGFGGRSRADFLKAMNAEGIPCHGGYSPLYREVLFQRISASQRADVPDYASFADRCPVCEQVCSDAVWFSQSMLLGARQDIDDIAAAIRKIQGAWG